MGIRPTLQFMDWTDSAILLSAKKQGESGLILSLLTSERGRHKGLIRSTRKAERGLYQPGSAGAAHWQARLSEHLGSIRFEVDTVYAAALLDDPLRLGCLQTAASLVDLALPERHPYPVLYALFKALLEALDADRDWAEAHFMLELRLLAELGYGLDLGCCAVTSRTDSLAYVSPKTGRAVSLEAGEAYRDKLLVLPRRLGGVGRAASSDMADAIDCLALTGFFIEKSVLAPFGTRMPEARQRHLDRLRRLVEAADGTKGE